MTTQVNHVEQTFRLVYAYKPPFRCLSPTIAPLKGREVRLLLQRALLRPTEISLNPGDVWRRTQPRLTHCYIYNLYLRIATLMSLFPIGIVEPRNHPPHGKHHIMAAAPSGPPPLEDYLSVLRNFLFSLDPSLSLAFPVQISRGLF